jgi:hypothetical protein
VYAINLESSILGGWVISEQEGPTHRIVQRLSSPLSYEDFRICALERALTKLEQRENAPNSEKKAQDFRPDVR